MNAFARERAILLARVVREAQARIRLARIFAAIPGGTWRSSVVEVPKDNP